jgi:ABC-type transporter Mla maintaining outer membrane lipid asymmetry permease subunit MlaE
LAAAAALLHMWITCGTVYWLHVSGQLLEQQQQRVEQQQFWVQLQPAVDEQGVQGCIGCMETVSVGVAVVLCCTVGFVLLAMAPRSVSEGYGWCSGCL